MQKRKTVRPVEILLVEDNDVDIELTREALRESKLSNHLNVVEDGEEALKYLKGEAPFHNFPKPDLILLDLNLPNMDGREVLAEIKKDENLRRIPVVVLTVSKDEQDILSVYNLHANCYITKPVDFEQFTSIVKSIENFWFTIVTLTES